MVSIMAATWQAAECGCDRLAARGGGQHHLRAPALLECPGDIRRIAVDIVMSAQFLRKLGPIGPAVDCDNLEPHAPRVLHAEVAQSADPEDRNQISGSCRRVPEGAEGR